MQTDASVPTILKMAEQVKHSTAAILSRLSSVNDVLSSTPKPTEGSNEPKNPDLHSTIQLTLSYLELLHQEVGRLERVIGVCPDEVLAGASRPGVQQTGSQVGRY